MADIFDEITAEPTPTTKPKGDIFDDISPDLKPSFLSRATDTIKSAFTSAVPDMGTPVTSAPVDTAVPSVLPKTMQEPPVDTNAPFLDRVVNTVKAGGKGIYQGITTELPRQIGDAMQFISEPGNPLRELGIEGDTADKIGSVLGTATDMVNPAKVSTMLPGVGETLKSTGKTISEWAGKRAEEEPLNKADVWTPEGMVYQGTKMLAPSVLPGLAATKLARASLGVNALWKAGKAAEAAAAGERALNAGSTAAGALFGLSQAQQTRESALEEAKKLEDSGDMQGAVKMREKAYGWQPYVTGAIEALGEILGTKYLGKMFRFVETDPINFKQFLKSLGVEIGTEMGQQFGEAAVEQQSGIRPDADPLSEAISVVGPTVIMTALTGAGAKGMERFQKRAEEQQKSSSEATGTLPKQESTTDTALPPVSPVTSVTPVNAPVNMLAPKTEAAEAAPVEEKPMAEAAPAEAEPDTVIPSIAPRPIRVNLLSPKGKGFETTPATDEEQRLIAQRNREQAGASALPGGIEEDLRPGPDVETPAAKPLPIQAPEKPALSALPLAYEAQAAEIGAIPPISPDQGSYGLRGLDMRTRARQEQADELGSMQTTNAPVSEEDMLRNRKVDEAAHAAAPSPLNALPQPSEPMKQAGNYQKGHIKGADINEGLAGLDISIENPAKSYRSGTDKQGKQWATMLNHHYGYIKGVIGADKDHIDTFIGQNPTSDKVFVVNQIDPQTGKLDEHKIMIGFNSKDEADKGYHENYQPGWTGRGSIVEMDMPQFREWLDKGDKKKAAETPIHGTAPISDRIASAFNERDKGLIYREEGLKAVPGIRLQDAEEAGRWAHMVETGDTTQDLFNKWIEQAKKENRIHTQKPATVANPSGPVKSLVAWINNKGGMNLGNMTGEFKEVTEHNGKAKFIKRTGDKTWGIDQLAQAAFDEGLIKDNEPQTLLDALKDKAWKAPSAIEQAAAEGEGKRKVDLASLKPGDSVVINGEKFTQQGLDKDGNMVWKDGEIIKVDPIETPPITVDKVIEGKAKAEDFALTPDEAPKEKPKKQEPAAGDLFGARGAVIAEGKKPEGEARLTELEQAKEIADAEKAKAEFKEKQGELIESGKTEWQKFLESPKARAIDEKYKSPSMRLAKKTELFNKTNATTSQTEKPKPEPSSKIEDFGEKLGGAKKDRQPSLDIELTDADIRNKPLSEIWPKKEVDGIEDTFIAAIASAARSEIPTKPRSGYKLDRWVETVKSVRSLAKLVQDKNLTREEFFDKLKGYKIESFGSKVILLESLERTQWDRIGKVREYPNAYRYGEGGEKIVSPFSNIEIDGKSQTYRVSSIMDALPQIQEALGVAPESRSIQFEVRGRGNRFFINKKGDPLYRPLKIFDNSKDALTFRHDKANYDTLVKAWEDVKEKENVKERDTRGDTNKPRVGADYRKGEDATPDMFNKAFGFRGVEFGNWVSQGTNRKERQGMLNSAYDAMMDLSDILNVPAKALSLDGTLGLGFGSRGTGWGSAHYEPDTLVINLTKTRGAGSLAHELFHAIDHYFQRQRGDVNLHKYEQTYITFAPEIYYKDSATNQRLPASRFNELKSKGAIRNPDSWTKVEGVRPEISEAFTDLVKALNDSPMAKRARLIDKGKSGGYWSRIIERAARSFENYVIYKMQQKGYHNDYLANVVAEKDFARDIGRYPYLLESEIAPVAEAFDNLFSTIKTKETDKGTAMFSRSDFEDFAASFNGGKFEAASPEEETFDYKTLLTKDYNKLTDKERFIVNSLMTPDEFTMSRVRGKMESRGLANEIGQTDSKLETLRTELETYLKKPLPLSMFTSGQVSDDINAAAGAVAGLFDKEVVFFHNNLPGAYNFNGVVLPSNNKRIYVNEATKKPALFVVGHELLHTLKRDRPDLYSYLADNVYDQMQNTEKYKKWLTRLMAKEGKTTSDALVYEEILADFMGDQFTQPKFWSAMSSNKPSIFRRLAKAVHDFFSRVLKSLKTESATSEMFFKDIEKARDIAAEVMAKYAVKGKGETAGDMAFSQDYKTAPFYSQLQKVIEGAGLPNQVTLKSLKALLNDPKNKVKAEEIADSGVLAVYGDKKIMPKQEILDYLKAVDRTDVQDVVLQARDVTKFKDIRFKMNNIKSILESDLEDRHLNVSREELRKQYEELSNELETLKTPEPHFSQYTEPGAIPGSYREQFVTAKESDIVTAHYDKLPEWVRTEKNAFGNWQITDSAGNKLGISKDIAIARQEALDTLNNKISDLSENWHDGHSQYDSIKNPIVRIRFNDRIDSDGNTIRFIEELQGPSKENEAKMPEIYKKYRYQIGLKRILQGIAEENVQRQAEGKPLITRLAWTPGDVQAERYDLSKHFGKIEAFALDNETYTIYGYEPSGKRIVDKQDIPKSELPDVVGKELAQKIIDQTYRRGEYSGLDLKVGGEGLKRLYDSTIPKFLEKYTGETADSADISVSKGDNAAEVKTTEDIKKYSKMGHMKFYFDKKEVSKNEAYKLIEQGETLAALGDTTLPVPSIPITPEMQSSILQEGQPLFSRIEEAQEKLTELTNKSNFVKGDVKPAISAATEGFGLAWDGIKRGAYPMMRSDDAALAGQAIIEQMGRSFHEQEKFKGQLNKVSREYAKSTSLVAKTLDLMQTSTGVLADKLFSKITPKEQYTFIHNMQNELPQATKELDAIAKTVRTMFDDLWIKATKVNPDLKESKKAYFPGMWENDKAAQKFFAERPRNMEGSKAFTKAKVFDDIYEGIEAGLTPKGTPLDMAFAKMHEIQKYVTTHNVLQSLEGNGVVLVRTGEQAPEDYRLIPAPYGVITKREEGGKIKSYHYAAKEDVAQIFENYLSRSLYDNKYIGKPYTAYMGVANALNQFQLGVGSAFHAGFTGMETIISHQALGIKALARGDFKAAAKYILESPLAVARNPKLGDKVLRAMRGDTAAMAEIPNAVQWLELAGARANMDNRLRTNTTDEMLKQWAAGNKAGAFMRSPFALVEQSARPILEWLVPRQKMGVFYEMANDWTQRNPNASHEELRKNMQYLWNRVDSRLGQVVYERMFTHNVAKNIVQALVRAPGWTGGTIVEIGGGVNDFAKVFKAIQRRERPVMTDKMAYTLSLLITTGLINGLLTLAFTGEPPDDKDLLAFRTGGLDEQGNPERFLLPTYAKDIYSYMNKPGTTLLNKTHPLISLMSDIAKNRDYYGVEVRHKQDNVVKQVGQVGTYAAKAFVPFWMRGAQKASDRGDNLASMAAPLIGIMPASSEFTKTKAQMLLGEILAERPQATITQEKKETRDLKRDITNKFRAKDPEANIELRKALKEGKINHRDAMQIRQNSRVDSLQRGFKMLSIEDAIRVFDAGTESEKKELRPLLNRKRALLRSLPAERRIEVLNELNRVMRPNV